MSDAMSWAEFVEQEVALLPARTVLSLFNTDLLGAGEAGTRGSNGEGQHGFTVLGMFGWGGSNPTPTTTDPSNPT